MEKKFNNKNIKNKTKKKFKYSKSKNSFKII